MVLGFLYSIYNFPQLTNKAWNWEPKSNISTTHWLKIKKMARWHIIKDLAYYD